MSTAKEYISTAGNTERAHTLRQARQTNLLLLRWLLKVALFSSFTVFLVWQQECPRVSVVTTDDRYHPGYTVVIAVVFWFL